MGYYYTFKRDENIVIIIYHLDKHNIILENRDPNNPLQMQ